MADKQTINAILDALQMEHQATPPASPAAGLSRFFLDDSGDAQLRRSNDDIDPIGGDSGENNADFIFIVDEKSNGVDGGTFTAGAERLRDLNSLWRNEGSHASLANDQITLPAGDYKVWISVPAVEVDGHRIRLYNTTATNGIATGSVGYASSGSNGSDLSLAMGSFTLSETSVLEVRHECETTQNNYGFGRAAGVGLSEIYTQVMLWKEP